MLNKEALNKLRVSALKEKNKSLKSIVSIIIGEVDLKEKGTDEKLSEKDIVKLVVKSIKNAKENLAVFKDRKDEAQIEATKNEIESLEKILTLSSDYKPPLSEDEITEIVKSVGSSMSDMGKVMSHLKSNYLGRYDAKTTSVLVKKILQG